MEYYPNLTNVEVLADSINLDNQRIFTVKATFSRTILAELNTHRSISKNSASSRAIPAKVMIQRGRDEPSYPAEWRHDQPGMKGGDELEGQDLEDAFQLLELIRKNTIQLIERYVMDHPDAEHRLHKTWLNRPMEWFQWHTAILTGSVDNNGWINFLNLRDHHMAQPEITILAVQVREALEDSRPKLLHPCDWHAPFVEDDDDIRTLEEALKTSAARCAWVSTMKHGKEATRDDVEDIYNKLTDGLRTGEPIHASPFEHQCTPAFPFEPQLGNLKGWRQLRHMIEMDIPPW